MKIIVYSLKACPWCIKVKQFLNLNRVEFEERDVSENEEYAKELTEKSNQRSVPVIDIDGKIIIGSDEEKLKEVLKI